jgi:hypothetical protein
MRPTPPSLQSEGFPSTGRQKLGEGLVGLTATDDEIHFASGREPRARRRVVREVRQPAPIGVDREDLAQIVLEARERDLLAVGRFTYTWKWAPVEREKTILEPSGDQAGSKSSARSSVMFTWPPPSGFITTISGFPNSPRNEVKAIFVASGDQFG